MMLNQVSIYVAKEIIKELRNIGFRGIVLNEEDDGDWCHIIVPINASTTKKILVVKDIYCKPHVGDVNYTHIINFIDNDYNNVIDWVIRTRDESNDC